jgi:ubiquinone/menaquinone biosynthesis C-methylase UbiE
VLEPRAGERLLELGPGSGHYAERVAEWVWPGGALDLLGESEADVEPAVRRARELGLDSVSGASAGDALPWPDATFDGAYAVSAAEALLGRGGMLDELARVVRPGGRLVVAGRGLRERAETAGFRVDRRTPLLTRYVR